MINLEKRFLLELLPFELPNSRLNVSHMLVLPVDEGLNL